MFLLLVRTASILLFVGLLSSCSTFEKSAHQEVDCSAFQSICHQGRFGLIWRAQQADGQIKVDTVSGTYEWRSGRTSINNNDLEIAHLEVSSTLGPSLGSAKRWGNFYEVRAADGRVYLAKDWQTLFNLIFPFELPAKALVQWMENPNSTELPPLPANWTWDNRNGKYRIIFVEKNTSGRIDLIPQDSLSQ
jgi:outer membrane biogenesis lipoprotein LolB